MAPADYKSTVKLPKTDFPMKADLPKREPATLSRWKGERLFQKILANRATAPKFAFHDGPPYANGHLHSGHVLNKILKDLVVKYKTMAGFKVDYIPGWDCHGLPIERALEEEIGREKKMAASPVEFRHACREYALKWVEIQSGEFQRLGVFGRYDQPYLTMTPGYEAIIAREFGRFVGNGGAYKGKRPVHWCWFDQTALAEAEVEYATHESPSIWVKFELPSDELPAEAKKALGGRKAYVVIWTTTPWTLPANLAIAFNPEFEYGLYAAPGNEAWIVACDLAKRFQEDTKTSSLELLAKVDPKKLERKAARHPFLDRKSLLVLADYVTFDAGTGCVHTAPGHGADDFRTGQRYGLETLTPVNNKGVLTQDAGPFAGEFIYKANPKIVEHLRASGHLVADAKLQHEYPHCWRCKKPVIFRATAQWFISMEKNNLRADALAEIDRTKWIPSWGRDRIHGMVANRPDWCISRQRTWGVPIVAFRCEHCSETHTTQALVEKAAALFEKEGSDAWYARPASDFIQGEKCPKCGKTDWKKEEDILDVWFESGVSFAAVCEQNPDLGFPVDLYLEGSDQHRGWFHSTLLASVGTRGKNAYKTCLTHGFVVDEKGEKLSKSKKNYVDLDKELEKSGADLLRLWVASSDYREDVRLSREILQRVGEAYFGIRNTSRGMLGNLFDFDPDKDRVPVRDMPEIDRFLLHRLSEVVGELRAAYDAWEFHALYHTVVNFYEVTLSKFYIDVMKDRLYCGTGAARRSAQTVLFECLSAITRAFAPVLSFTCEEIWAAMPAWKGKQPSVHMESLPDCPPAWRDEKLAERWSRVLGVRDAVLKELEVLRASQDPLRKEQKAIEQKKDRTPAEQKRFDELERVLVGKNDDARVTLEAKGEEMSFLKGVHDALAEAFAVSEVALVEGGDGKLRVTVGHAKGDKCARCRRWYASLKGDLCERCAKAVGS